MRKRSVIICIVGVLIALAIICGVALLIASSDHPGSSISDVSLVVGATDWLSFWGTIAGSLLGAGIAIAGVWWSLRANQKQYHQDQINQTLPYFMARYYQHKSNYNAFA